MKKCLLVVALMPLFVSAQNSKAFNRNVGMRYAKDVLRYFDVTLNHPKTCAHVDKHSCNSLRVMDGVYRPKKSRAAVFPDRLKFKQRIDPSKGFNIKILGNWLEEMEISIGGATHCFQKELPEKTKGYKGVVEIDAADGKLRIWLNRRRTSEKKLYEGAMPNQLTSFSLKYGHVTRIEMECHVAE